MIEIRRYISDLLFSNMYIIVESGHAIVIDPCQNTAMAGDLMIDKIILTHEHYDHISGVNAWKEKTYASVLCSKICAKNIQSSKNNLANYFKEFCELQTWVELAAIPSSDPDYFCTAEECFEDDLKFGWLGHTFHLFEMPGHSLGSIGIIMDDHYFFSGDSLMENNDIELRMPGGSRKKWSEIGKPRLDRIPKGVMVFPGHFKEFMYEEGGENIGIPI